MPRVGGNVGDDLRKMVKEDVSEMRELAEMLMNSGGKTYKTKVEFDGDASGLHKEAQKALKDIEKIHKEAEEPIDVFNYDKGSVKKRVDELKTSINAAMDVVNSGGKLTKNNGISVKNFLKDYGELSYYFEKIGQEMDSSIK